VPVSIALAGIALAGCSGGSSSDTAAPPTSPTATVTTTVTSTPTTVVTAPASTAATSTPAACKDGSIRISIGRSGAALGNVFTVLVFHNITAQSCILRGYPGVTPYDGTEKGTPAQRRRGSYFGNVAIKDVILEAGGEASALVSGDDNPVDGKTSCPMYDSATVTPPNTYRAITVPLKMPACTRLGVQAVHSGTHGTSEIS
jgi:hypothetical protein